MESEITEPAPTQAQQQPTFRSRVLGLPQLKLIEQVGTGGMSTVWKAWDIPNQRLVAVKILNREYAADGMEIRQFRDEERMMEEIDHPGIVRAYDFANANGTWYYIMEFVDGYSFADLLRRKQHIRESDCLLIGESVASALDCAWNDHGVIHCDLKPENIMINTEGIVKLTDLGISHRFDYGEDGRRDVPEHVTGTPAYISPEQVYGDVEPDCRADIYSLGATLYHLATGRVLFPRLGNEDTLRAHCDPETKARDPRLYRPELSEGFCQMLEAMLVKDREQRVTSWQDVCQMCKDVEAGMAFRPRDTTSPSSIALQPIK